jgi:hypothetical protein
VHPCGLLKIQNQCVMISICSNIGGTQVVIFDEAHNIEDISRESAWFVIFVFVALDNII